MCISIYDSSVFTKIGPKSYDSFDEASNYALKYLCVVAMAICMFYGKAKH